MEPSLAKPSIEPVARSTLSLAVTERLRDLVVRGTYPPGTQLSEVELADRFGVSRGPIRESLQRLVHDGLLRSEPHRGVFIPSMDDLDIEDIYLAREAVEGAALRILVRSGRAGRLADDLARLIRQMHDASEARRWARLAELDLRFHTEIVRAADSPRLWRMFSSVIDETRVLLSMTASRPGRDEPVGDHMELVQVLTSGDVEVAQRALAMHFARSRSTLARQLESERVGAES